MPFCNSESLEISSEGERGKPWVMQLAGNYFVFSKNTRAAIETHTADAHTRAPTATLRIGSVTSCECRIIRPTQTCSRFRLRRKSQEICAHPQPPSMTLPLAIRTVADGRHSLTIEFLQTASTLFLPRCCNSGLNRISPVQMEPTTISLCCRSIKTRLPTTLKSIMFLRKGTA